VTHTPVIPGLLEPRRHHPLAPASRHSWERIRPTLTAREREVGLLLARYVAETGRADATGGELAHWSGVPVTRARGGVEPWVLAGRAGRGDRAGLSEDA